MRHGRLIAVSLAAAACGDNPTTAGGGLSAEETQQAVTLENRGIGAMERSDFSGAVPPLREAMRIAPAWIPGRFNLALALTHADPANHAEAAQILDGILKDLPDHPNANVMAAWLEERAGADQQERALALFDKAYAVTGADPDVGAKYGGLLARIDGREKDAIAVLVECHAKRPTLIAPVYHLMLLSGRIGDEAKANQYRDELEALKPQARETVARLAMGPGIQSTYGSMGPYSKAIRDIGVPHGRGPMPR